MPESIPVQLLICLGKSVQDPLRTGVSSALDFETRDGGDLEAIAAVEGKVTRLKSRDRGGE
jgi:hypothetical protein